MTNEQQKYNMTVAQAALNLIESPGMTVNRLRDLREDQIRIGFRSKVDQLYYDVVMAAIDLMERPLFQ
jgi:hypothetical protein